MATITPFGQLPDGRKVTAYTITSETGLRLRLIDLGAGVQALEVPTVADLGGAEPAEGKNAVNVVLGFADVASYLTPPKPFFGAIVGRYANRIADSTFVLDGVRHHVAPNEGPNCLHGGPDGYDTRIWSVVDHADSEVTFALVSPDGDAGFPGELRVTARYAVAGSTVTIELTATTDAPTIVSLTNHAYFNLAGEGRGTIDEHLLTIDADGYLPIDASLIPSEGVAPVAGTPFDFTSATSIGPAVREDHPQVRLVNGIDHSFDLRGSGLRRAARLEHQLSGRVLEIHTDQPGLQIYAGNGLAGVLPSTSGRFYRQGDGIAMETQRHPDAQNQPWLPDPVLRPGETYRSVTMWTLS